MPTIAFNKPFAEQQAYFRAKLNRPTETYKDIQGAAHDHAFAVAGAMQADLLADLRYAVDLAITEGKGLGAFKKDFKSITEQYGWSHTGTADWRARVIYQTNLRTSHAAGRYEQLTQPSTTAARPLWRYVHSDTVLDPRPEHQAWDGKILAADDPWWDTHYPPNGWGCQCTVQAIALDELASYGKTQPDTAPTPPGSTQGIDQGWDYAPGKSASDVADLVESKGIGLAKRDTEIARSYVARLMQDEGFSKWHDNITEQVAKLKTATKLPNAQAVEVLREQIDDQGAWPVAVLSLESQGWLSTNAKTVAVSTETLIKQAYEHPDIVISDYRNVQDMLDQAQVVVQEFGGNHLLFFKQGERFTKAVIKVTSTRKSLFLQSLHVVGERYVASAKKKGRVVRDLFGKE